MVVEDRHIYPAQEKKYIYPLSVLEDEPIDTHERYEFWLSSYISEEILIATVKECTYFEEGQKIVFHRVDNDD